MEQYEVTLPGVWKGLQQFGCSKPGCGFDTLKRPEAELHVALAHREIVMPTRQQPSMLFGHDGKPL